MNPTQQTPESNQQNQAPQPEPTAQSTVTSTQVPQPAAQHEKNTLGVVGFVLAFIASAVGLVVSLIALNKARHAGAKNTLALWGAILSAVFLVLQIAMIASVATYMTSPQATQCLETGAESVKVDGRVYECPAFLQGLGALANGESSTTDTEGTRDDSPQSIMNTPVTLSGSTSTSICWSLTVPEGYLQSPYAGQCQTELRYDDGTATGSSLTAITLKPQVGDERTVEDFFEKMDKYAASGLKVKSQKRVEIDGRTAGYVEVVNSLSIKQHMYFIPDETGAFTSSNGTVVSFLLTGPAYTDGSDPVGDVAASLRFKN